MPDLFDLGASRGARVALTAPDGAADSFAVDAALGFWTDFIDAVAPAGAASSGSVGIVGEVHRSTAAGARRDTRRLALAGWIVLSPAPGIFIPTTEGVARRWDRRLGTETNQAFVKAALVLPAGRESLLRPFLASTSYAPILGGRLRVAGAPAIGLNHESAAVGGTGRVTRLRADYSLSIAGETGRLRSLSLDVGAVHQRRISGRGALGGGARDASRVRAALGYTIAPGVALVAERIDGEDPFEATGVDHVTSVTLRFRFGTGP